MFVATTDGLTLWNRSLSMLENGHLPSDVALHLYQCYGVRIGSPSPEAKPDRDQAVIDYFSRLPIPADAIDPPSIFDSHWGEA